MVQIFGGGGSHGAPRPPVDTRLADAPRRIPASFLLAEALPFRWWYVFALFMIAIPPIALWIAYPGLLKWGRVASVTGAEVLSRGTYYSGTTYSNVFLPQAHGWTVTRDRFSGGSTKTRVHYALDGYQGALVLRGRSYDDGVVLADSRNPQRALCVSSFAYDLNRDETGNWVGRLRTRLKVGMVVWVFIMIAWLAIGFGISTGIANRVTNEVFATRLSPGGTGSVHDGGTVYCNDGHLSTDGIDYHVTVHGHCASLDISGIDGVVTIDSVDSVTVSGIDNQVICPSGQPVPQRG
jgi:hypothetical protein